MKRISLVLVAVLVILCGFSCFAYAENTLVEEVGVGATEDTTLGKVLEIFDMVTRVSLPACAIFFVAGAVQYFINGIRNLYKKKQGLILMFSSMTFYVIVVAINFVLTYITYGDFSNVIDTVGSAVIEVETAQIEDTLMEKSINILNYATNWSLPFCAILVVFGAVQYYVLGIRNLYKKRQGLLLMFGSIAFYAIIVVVNFVLTRISFMGI